jgi:hypothetical protein
VTGESGVDGVTGESGVEGVSWESGVEVVGAPEDVRGAVTFGALLEGT